MLCLEEASGMCAYPVVQPLPPTPPTTMAPTPPPTPPPAPPSTTPVPTPQPTPVPVGPGPSDGGSAGWPKGERWSDSTLYEAGHILKSVCFHVDIGINGMEAIYGNVSTHHGGDGGTPYCFDHPVDQFITKVSIWCDRDSESVKAVAFTTDTGMWSGEWGGNGGSKNMFEAPEGYRLVAFYGSTNGTNLSMLGVYWDILSPNVTSIALDYRP